MDGLLLGFALGIVFGIVIDRGILAPLVFWHARQARRGRR